jgi:IMP cyclohydrolase
MLRLRAGPRPVSPGYRVSSRSAAERDTANRSQNVT